VRIRRAVRWVVLAAVLVGVLPSAGSAQLGGFIKRKLKQKAVSTAVDTVVSKVAGGGDSAAASVKASAGASAQVTGPAFDDNTLEITPAVLDRFEKVLSSQQGHRLGKTGAATLQENNLTALQYSMLKERVLPFCADPDAAQTADAAVKVRGAGSGVFYVYTQGEIEAMRPHCSKLAQLIKGAP